MVWCVTTTYCCFDTQPTGMNGQRQGQGLRNKV